MLVWYQYKLIDQHVYYIIYWGLFLLLLRVTNINLLQSSARKSFRSPLVKNNDSFMIFCSYFRQR